MKTNGKSPGPNTPLSDYNLTDDEPTEFYDWMEHTKDMLSEPLKSALLKSLNREIRRHMEEKNHE